MAKRTIETSDPSTLHESYGKPVEQPKMVKGEFDNFGILAGDGSITPKRNINFQDSIDDHKRNQPKSH